MDDRLAEKPRRCLKCNREFLSINAGNRICGACKTTQPTTAGNTLVSWQEIEAISHEAEPEDFQG